MCTCACFSFDIQISGRLLVNSDNKRFIHSKYDSIHKQPASEQPDGAAKDKGKQTNNGSGNTLHTTVLQVEKLHDDEVADAVRKVRSYAFFFIFFFTSLPLIQQGKSLAVTFDRFKITSFKAMVTY